MYVAQTAFLNNIICPEMNNQCPSLAIAIKQMFPTQCIRHTQGSTTLLLILTLISCLKASAALTSASKCADRRQSLHWLHFIFSWYSSLM